MNDGEPREQQPPKLLISAELQNFAKEAAKTSPRAPEIVRSFSDFYGSLEPLGHLSYSTLQEPRRYSGMYFDNNIIDLLQDTDVQGTERSMDPFAQLPTEAIFRLRLATKREPGKTPIPTLSIHVRGPVKKESADALEDLVSYQPSQNPHTSRIDIDLEKENLESRVTAALELTRPLIHERLDSTILEDKT